MKVEIQDAGPCQKRVTVEVDAERVRQKLDESFRELQSFVTIRGFRRGKAPRHILERRFGKEVREQVKENLILESLQEVLDEKGLKLAADPEVEEEKFDDSGPFSFTTKIEVFPEFDLPSYKNVEVTKTQYVVTEEDVERELAKFFEETNRTFKAVEGELQKGDMAIVNVTVKVDGEQVDSFEEVELFPHRDDLGGLTLDQVEEMALGKKQGDSFSWTGEIPKEYPREEVRGKEGIFEIEILEVKRPKYESPCEEWAKELDFESLEEVRQKLKERLEREAQQRTEKEFQKKVLEKLLEDVEIPLPPSLVQRAMRDELHHYLRLLYLFGASEEQLQAALEEKQETLQEEVEYSLRVALLLDKLAESEKIFVTESEVEAEVAQRARQQNRDPQEYWNELEERGELAHIRRELRREKAIQHILKYVKVSTTEEKPLGGEDEE